MVVVRWTRPLRRPLQVNGAAALAPHGGPHDAEAKSGADGRPLSPAGPPLSSRESTREPTRGPRFQDTATLPVGWEGAPRLVALLDPAVRLPRLTRSGRPAWERAIEPRGTPAMP